MATSVTTTTAAPVTTTTATTTATATATATGLSTASTLTSAAPAQSSGFSATISSWVSSVVDAIRNCLAKLPLIGSFFATAQPVTTTAVTTTAAATTTPVDADYVNMIKNVFVAAPGTGATTTAAVPSADVVAYALDCFNRIQAPAAKMEAFQAVLAAANSTDGIATQFYGALDAAQQTAFRSEIWVANGRSSIDATGVNRSVGFGEHIVATDIRGALAQQAIRNVIANLAAATSTTASTATSTTI